MSEHSDTVRSLSKQWFKTGDNHFLDELKDVTKRWVDRKVSELPPSPRHVERYKNGSLSVHFHFRAVPNDVLIENGTVPQFLVFEPNPLLRKDIAKVVVPPDEFSVSCNESSERKRVMLVSVVEPGQTPESIPSVIRLQSFDDCDLLHRNSLEFGKTVREEVACIGADREICVVLTCAPPVTDNQLTDKMVECSPDITKEVASDKA